MKNKPEPVPPDTAGDIPANEASKPDAQRVAIKIGDWSSLTSEEIAQRVADRPGFRLGRDQVLQLIKAVALQNVPDTTATVCILTCHSGHVELGMSACIDPATYDEDVGRTLALNNAIDKLYQKEGYLALIGFKSMMMQQEQAAAEGQAVN